MEGLNYIAAKAGNVVSVCLSKISPSEGLEEFRIDVRIMSVYSYSMFLIDL